MEKNKRGEKTRELCRKTSKIESVIRIGINNSNGSNNSVTS